MNIIQFKQMQNLYETIYIHIYIMQCLIRKDKLCVLISVYYIIFLTLLLDHNNCLRSVFVVKSVDFKSFIVTVPSFDDIEY